MTDDMDETARAEFLLMKLLRTRWGSFSSVFLRYALALGFLSGRGVALGSSSCRLAHTNRRVAERTSPDVVRAGNDARIRSRGAPECFRFPATRGALLLAHSERFPFSVDNLPFRRRHTGQETADSVYQRRSPERRINFKEMR